MESFQSAFGAARGMEAVNTHSHRPHTVAAPSSRYPHTQVMNQCQLEEMNPYCKEWAILALRNLTNG
jgi:hypothetical protein